MGLSRNKVAVSEGAAGSPPFYGESTPIDTISVVKNERGKSFVVRCSILKDLLELITQYGGVAQLGEHLPCKQGVMGSNPIISTMAHSSGG